MPSYTHNNKNNNDNKNHKRKYRKNNTKKHNNTKKLPAWAVFLLEIIYWRHRARPRTFTARQRAAGKKVWY